MVGEGRTGKEKEELCVPGGTTHPQDRERKSGSRDRDAERDWTLRGTDGYIT